VIARDGTAMADEFSVAMTSEVAMALRRHLKKPEARQEDLTFAVWRPSRGERRLTAVVQRVLLPGADERILQGNVAFTAAYLVRVLGELKEGEGLALIHSHLGPGWQDMSDDDVVAERDRLAGAVFGRTGLPVVGLTWGTDDAWSARCWNRVGPGVFDRQWATHVRVVGRTMSWTFHPALRPVPTTAGSQVATVSVWGERAQADLVRCRVGVVGLGSVGSLVNEALARLGIRDVTLIDHDHVEERNLDRTAGALAADAKKRSLKVEVAGRHASAVATAGDFHVREVPVSVLTPEGLAAALDCDVLFSCVDRPWPRHLLNSVAYAHLIPVIDGGVLVAVDGDRLLHADWRVHAVGPRRPCLVCLGALDLGDVALDMAGKLDEPDYVRNLPPERSGVISRRNVYAFSMSVAAHEVLQCIGVVTGNERIGGSAPQFYHCYPGVMECLTLKECQEECGYAALTAMAADLSGNLSATAAKSVVERPAMRMPGPITRFLRLRTPSVGVGLRRPRE
jgi:hypothetical protein